MSSFLRALAAERLKLVKSRIWLLLPLSPLISALIGIMITFRAEDAGAPYQALIMGMTPVPHAMLLLPILTGIFAAFVCRYEHGGGWKLMLSLPLSRSGLFFAKFVVVALMLAVVQLLFLAAILAAALYHGIEAEVPWSMLLRCVIGGWVACLPLAAVQLGVSIAWTSFAAPLVINVMLTLPNILIVNSARFAPFYPWAQPLLAMMPSGSGSGGVGGFMIPYESLMITVLGSFVVFFMAGLIYLNRKEI